MLSVSLIERTLETRDYDRLLRDLTDNGMVLPLSLRMHLGQSPTAVLALALRRLVELTYGPTALSRQLVDRLIRQQRPDGTFGDGAGGTGEARDVLTTAAVMAGLDRVVADHPAAVGDELRTALEHGGAALAGLQDCDGLFTAPSDRSLADRALTTAFILSLLGEDASFRSSVRLNTLHRWFERYEGRLDRHTQHLWDLASIALDNSTDFTEMNSSKPVAA